MATTWNKPAGLPVFPPHQDPSGPCVLRDLLAAQPWREQVVWPEGYDGGILHRLDVATSGALWLADDTEELVALRKLFGERKLTKKYLFQAAKDVPWNQHECDRPIAHDKRHKRRMVVQRGPETPHRGKWYPAQTAFERVHENLWRAEITTGVMHQIRVHAAFLGIPLQGDSLYGGGDTPEGWQGDFRLHHVGLLGPDGRQTSSVPTPRWAR